MFLIITEVKIASFLEYGLSFSNASLGGSVANARAAKVSIIRFTHNIYTDVNGDSPKTTPPKNTMNIATILTVN
jgi:hypothetical protein